jgi:hypothetical protein
LDGVALYPRKRWGRRPIAVLLVPGCCIDQSGETMSEQQATPDEAREIEAYISNLDDDERLVLECLAEKRGIALNALLVEMMDTYTEDAPPHA